MIVMHRILRVAVVSIKPCPRKWFVLGLKHWHRSDVLMSQCVPLTIWKTILTTIWWIQSTFCGCPGDIFTSCEISLSFQTAYRSVPAQLHQQQFHLCRTHKQLSNLCSRSMLFDCWEERCTTLSSTRTHPGTFVGCCDCPRRFAPVHPRVTLTHSIYALVWGCGNESFLSTSIAGSKSHRLFSVWWQHARLWWGRETKRARIRHGTDARSFILEYWPALNSTSRQWNNDV